MYHITSVRFEIEQIRLTVIFCEHLGDQSLLIHLKNYLFKSPLNPRGSMSQKANIQ